MDSIWINAPAKINIGLDVIRRREDFSDRIVSEREDAAKMATTK